MAFGDSDVEYLKTLKEHGFAPSVIYDIGASNSLWTQCAFKVFPNAKYECFEPLASVNENYARGWNNTSAAHLVRARLHEVAVSDLPGTAKFFVLGAGGVGSTLLGESYVGKTEITVQTETLDGMIMSEAIAAPDMIKLDIQGGEMQALVGGRDIALRSAQVVVMEAWVARGYGPTTPLIHEMMAFLADEGLFAWEFGDEYRDEAGTLIAKDVWFVRADSELGRSVWGQRAPWF
jgi:FkbM family methyltransferase